jgi:hypothetical protein
VTGTTGATGPTGATEVDAGVTESFELSEGSPIGAGSQFTFSNNEAIGPHVSHNIGTSSFEVLTAGSYLIEFEANGLEIDGNDLEAEVAVRVAGSTVKSFVLQLGDNTMEMTRSLSVGNTVQFQNNDNTLEEVDDQSSVFTRLSPFVGVRVKFTLLSPAN